MIVITFLQSITNSSCCDFNKDCFKTFINALYSRDGIDKEAKVIYISFLNHNDEMLFSKRIKLKDKTIYLEKRKIFDKKNLLIIKSIAKSEFNEFKVEFLFEVRGFTKDGSITIGFENQKPVFKHGGFVKGID